MLVIRCTVSRDDTRLQFSPENAELEKAAYTLGGLAISGKAADEG
jgi:hypothetical protein